MAVHDEIRPMLEHVTVTQARNLMPVFDTVIRDDRPIMITRYKRDEAVLSSRTQLLRLLESFSFHVDVIPEPDGGFTLAVRELNIAEDGDSLLDARRNLLAGVRSYVRHYFDVWDMYKHMPDMRAQEPYVVRLSLAETDDELIGMLFGPRPDREWVAMAGAMVWWRGHAGDRFATFVRLGDIANA